MKLYFLNVLFMMFSLLIVDQNILYVINRESWRKKTLISLLHQIKWNLQVVSKLMIGLKYLHPQENQLKARTVFKV